MSDLTNDTHLAIFHKPINFCFIENRKATKIKHALLRKCKKGKRKQYPVILAKKNKVPQVIYDFSTAVPTLDGITEVGYKWCACVECFAYMPCYKANPDYGHHNGWEYPAYTEHSCPHCENTEPMEFTLTRRAAKVISIKLKKSKYD